MISRPSVKSGPALAIAGTIALGFTVTASADPSARLAELVGQRVIVELDMPATKDGVDVRPGRGTFDRGSYAERIERHGTAIVAGEVQTITRIKVKGKHIEFQLGGGGYGTLWDETPHVTAPQLVKTDLERNLERELDRTDDRYDRMAIEEELGQVRADREREQAWLDLEAERVSELKRRRIATLALDAGSRFNLRFDGAVPASAATPDGLKSALRGFVVFLEDSPAIPSGLEDLWRGVHRGMSATEVEARLGAASSVVERQEGELLVAAATFDGPAGPVHALFVEGVLIRLDEDLDTF